MDSTRAERAIEKIARLSGEASSLVAFWAECTEVLGEIVPYYWTPCWYTVDPASLLITSHYHNGLSEFPAEEYFGEDVNQIADVVRSPDGLSTLHEATGEDPSSSERWRQNMELGGDQELILALRSRSGDPWGALGLYREPGQTMFDGADKQFLRAVSPYLALGARRSLLVGEATDPEGPQSPCLLILDERWRVHSATAGAERRMNDFPDGDWAAGRLPSAVLAVAHQAAALANGRSSPDGVVTSRVASRTGEWMELHGSEMPETGVQRVAVIVESARPASIYPLLMSAYGLTEREQDVTRLVLQGDATTDIAETLVVSAHTVQQHLKSIFEKTGVRSRRELVGKVFFSHYEPRFRENERRVAVGMPVRGGPMPLGR